MTKDAEAPRESEDMNGILYAVSARGIISYVCPGAEKLCGCRASEVMGRMFDRFIHAEDRAAVRANYGRTMLGLREPLECRILTKNGATRWVRLQSRPVAKAGSAGGVQGVVVDITEHRSLEERFRQAEKMEAVGRLAGGVAHDFNNMLMVIQGFGDVLGRSLPAEDKRQTFIAEIRKASKLAASLTQQLLTFACKSASQRAALNLGLVVGDAEKTIKRLIGPDISLAVSIDPLTPSVRMDRSELDRVLANLASNARDAMPAGGTLSIRTSLMVADEASGSAPGMAPGEYALVAVSDTGSGISEEVLAHLYEPFFTTKAKGKGRGLGLATVYGIVKQSGGSIWCASQKEVGTTFSFCLPALNPQAPAAESGTDESTQLCRGQTILLVEDENALRTLIERVLEESGCTVLSCRNGQEAVRISMENAGPVHLLIADMDLPDAGATEIARSMSGRWPEVRVILLTGYADWDDLLREGGVSGCMRLQKPFEAETLLKLAQSLLAKEGMTSA